MKLVSLQQHNGTLLVIVRTRWFDSLNYSTVFRNIVPHQIDYFFALVVGNDHKGLDGYLHVLLMYVTRIICFW